MKSTLLITLSIVSVLSVMVVSPSAAADSTETILQRFVDDYSKDPMAASITFGLEVDGQRWHVVSEPGEAGKASVALNEGFPDSPIFYFTTSSQILQQIDAGSLSGLTAMGAATSAQVTPLDVLFSDGYTKPADYDAMLRPLVFHFWTRGKPETAPLSIEHSRVVHGAPAVVMYYDKDFRSAIYHVPAGLSRDMAPTMAVPFPRVLVVMSGTMTGTVGDDEFAISAGKLVFLPPDIPAQLWNDGEETLEFMFLMFGDGA